MVVLAVQGGCTTVDFLTQAAWGHLDVITRSQPIDVLIRQEDTPKKLRSLLAEVEPIKEYGMAQGLAASDSYSTYVQLDRSAVVWSVVACPPLSFEAHTWRFPIVGSVPYLGWFSRDDADAFARQMHESMGYDVAVRPVSAYSTLGWFDDPLLSTMIARGPHVYGTLVNTVLHESVHATFYIHGQSYFNENLATFVADRMTPQYLEGRYGPHSRELLVYERAQKEWRWRLGKMGAAYEALEALYASDLPDEEKLDEKAKILGTLRHDLQSSQPLSNATLVDFRTYRAAEDDLEKLYQACYQDWQHFLGAITSLKASDFSQEQQQDLSSVVDILLQRGCRTSLTSRARAGGSR